MKRKLQRIVSAVCALALMIGCGVCASLAEGADNVIRYITVEWVDEDNYDNLRKDVSVSLGGQAPVVLSEANGWFIEKTDLPTKINGEPVTYSWKEEEIVGYTLSGQSAAGAAYVFTNRAREIPDIPPDQPQPRTPGGGWVIFEEYDTALGGETLINHVGDCFD